MWFKASAPGSLMLLGEYAVLQGGQALVCAIDKRITIYLSPRTDTKISISSRLGKFSCDLTNIIIQSPFQFVLTAINQFQTLLKTGCDITIESEFSNVVGFGSSAAVTVATIAALSTWLNQDFDNMQLIHQARAVVQTVQGQGSGSDVAACVLGGVVAYRMEPIAVEILPAIFPITVVYSGSKTMTADAIKLVQASFAEKPQLYQEICHGINSCAELGVNYIKQKKWHELGEVMNSQQRMMDELGVSTPILNQIIENLRQQPDILGAKISGSGLGDCAVGLGTIETIEFQSPEIIVLPTSISTRGIECENG